MRHKSNDPQRTLELHASRCWNLASPVNISLLVNIITIIIIIIDLQRAPMADRPKPKAKRQGKLLGKEKELKVESTMSYLYIYTMSYL